MQGFPGACRRTPPPSPQLAHTDPHPPTPCPPASLQAALAALSGIQEVPEPRSLLTMEEGVQTLLMMSKPGRIQRPSHVRWVIGGQPGGSRGGRHAGRVEDGPELEAGWRVCFGLALAQSCL